MTNTELGRGKVEVRPDKCLLEDSTNTGLLADDMPVGVYECLQMI